MPKITGYREGVPCWVDLAAPDIAEAKRFYSELFGWDYVDTGPEGGGYQLARLKGELVAGIGPLQPEQGGSAWTTYLWSDDVGRTTAAIEQHDGRVLMGPMDVMEQGRMAIAADPPGAVFGVWQGRAHRGAGLVNEPGTFIWNENLSTDPATARAFYQQVFGYEYEAVEEPSIDYTLIKVEGRPVGGIGEHPPSVPQGTPSFWNTYFAVEDADRAAARIRELGGEILVEPNDMPYGRMAVARDNGGATVSIIAPAAGGSQG